MRTSNRDRKTATLSIRTSVDLRSKLQSSLEESGRSLTQEVEMRLEKSFQGNEFVGGERNSAFLNVLGAGIKEIELSTGRSWLYDRETWERVARHMRKLVDEREPGDETLSPGLRKLKRGLEKRQNLSTGENGD